MCQVMREAVAHGALRVRLPQFCSRRIHDAVYASDDHQNCPWRQDCVPRRSNISQSNSKSERRNGVAYPLDGGGSPEGGSGASNEQTHFDMQCLESKNGIG